MERQVAAFNARAERKIENRLRQQPVFQLLVKNNGVPMGREIRVRQDATVEYPNGVNSSGPRPGPTSSQGVGWSTAGGGSSGAFGVR